MGQRFGGGAGGAEQDINHHWGGNGGKQQHQLLIGAMGSNLGAEPHRAQGGGGEEFNNSPTCKGEGHGGGMMGGTGRVRGMMMGGR